MKVFLARMAEPAEHFTRKTNTTVLARTISLGTTVNFVSATNIFPSVELYT